LVEVSVFGFLSALVAQSKVDMLISFRAIVVPKGGSKVAGVATELAVIGD